MNRARRKFLYGPRFALDQDCRIATGEFPDQAEGIQIRRRSSDKIELAEVFHSPPISGLYGNDENRNCELEAISSTPLLRSAVTDSVSN